MSTIEVAVPRTEPPVTVEIDQRPAVLALDGVEASDPVLAGAKAAALARAAAAGLPVLPGFVVSTAATSVISARREGLPSGLEPELAGRGAS